MKKSKKALYIILFGLDFAITVFLLVVSVIRLVKLSSRTTADILNAKGFFGYLRNHTTFYFCLFVLPLFLLLAANIVGLVLYVRKSTKAEPIQRNQLSDEQKAQLRKEGKPERIVLIHIQHSRYGNAASRRIFLRKRFVVKEPVKLIFV